mmetsp:Transcript_7013/g.15220  ORF Transcript_7013/g.15220 Transcript_7013/m.15220 type:complete len:212 (+) Transcript_7013:520-1155(+)
MPFRTICLPCCAVTVDVIVALVEAERLQGGAFSRPPRALCRASSEARRVASCMRAGLSTLGVKFPPGPPSCGGQVAINTSVPASRFSECGGSEVEAETAEASSTDDTSRDPGEQLRRSPPGGEAEPAKPAPRPMPPVLPRRFPGGEAAPWRRAAAARAPRSNAPPALRRPVTQGCCVPGELSRCKWPTMAAWICRSCSLQLCSFLRRNLAA